MLVEGEGEEEEEEEKENVAHKNEKFKYCIEIFSQESLYGMIAYNTVAESPGKSNSLIIWCFRRHDRCPTRSIWSTSGIQWRY